MSQEKTFLSSNFPDKDAFITNLIHYLASETEPYDLILIKRKISQKTSENSIKQAFPMRKALKNRHKNCPKLFGRAFFRLLLRKSEFRRENLTFSNLLIKAAENHILYNEIQRNSKEIK